jgi:hypothetical protein
MTRLDVAIILLEKAFKLFCSIMISLSPADYNFYKIATWMQEYKDFTNHEVMLN